MRAFICRFWAQAGCGKRRLFVCALAAICSLTPACEQRFDRARGIVMRGTIVTMDAAGTILQNGSVLVRNDKIVAIWSGPTPPTDVPVGNAIEIDGGPDALIFPGLINLHDHPSFDALQLWPPPSSHVQKDLGRPNGTEPYANRYQWNGMKGPRYATPAQEQSDLITKPYDKLNEASLAPEVGKYAQVKAILGGETASEGGQDDKANNILIRNVEHTNFGHGRIERRVQPIGNVKPTCSPCPSPVDPDCLDCLLTPMQSGQVDAWIVHLAEGVRDGQRREKDTVSSREEFQILKNLGLLTGTTVIVHGIALEPEDFVAMHDAPSAGTASVTVLVQNSSGHRFRTCFFTVKPRSYTKPFRQASSFHWVQIGAPVAHAIS
jgi:5-methylthioadenosine/S-adenosylhomocysteine deaminase